MLASDQKLSDEGLSSLSLNVLSMREAVLADWEADVRRLVQGASEILHPVLINTMPVFYDNIAEALSPQHPREQATSNNDLASAHGNERARLTSFGPDQVVHEYQLFRESFFRVAGQRRLALGRAEMSVIHTSIDSAIREAVKEFTAIHDDFRHQLAAALSHDMRTPLSVLMGTAELMGVVRDESKRPALLSKILSNGRRLGGMIDKLLDALSFRQGQRIPLTLSKFDILDVAHLVAQQAAIEAQAAPIVIGSPAEGYWCQDSIQRALENLVANALKYGDGKEVRIKIDTGHERLFLSVHNTGSHIPEQHQERIFQYLWRERENTALKGWGIGLPFVQNVAQSHGGSVVVDSSPEAGTTFLIDIPLDGRPFVDSPNECP